MTDIVERLRAFPAGDGEGGLFHDAAAEVERLRALISDCPVCRELNRQHHRALEPKP